ncbi:MAG TPA: TAXI family TRAP transporter solute-binding subunit [Burkholderiales bacterium]
MALGWLRRLTGSGTAALLLPAAAVIALGFWLAYQFVQPAPPHKLVITTGAESGAYHAFAKSYRQILARSGVDLELRPSSGAIENLKRLRDPASGVMAGFVQGGVGDRAEAPELESLGALFFEPMWVFHRGNTKVDRLSQLLGKRIAVGAEGSGTRELALQLLAANGVTPGNAFYFDVGADAAAQALRSGKLDVALIVSAAESPLVHDLLREDGIRPASLTRAPAYVQRFPYLTPLVLLQGSVDLVLDLPARDTMLVAPTANLVVRSDIHPALVGLLMDAIKEVHGGTGYFHKAGDFPAPRTQEFPLNPEAERFYRRGTPFLQRYLPFWAAILVERLWVMLVPLVALVIPLSRLLPPLYNWRMRARVYRWYRVLREMEQEVGEHVDPARVYEYLERLHRLDEEVMRRPLPLAFSEDLYILREHIELVRRKVSGSRGPERAA